MPNLPSDHFLMQRFKLHYKKCINQDCQQIMQGIVSYETKTRRTVCWECEQEAKDDVQLNETSFQDEAADEAG